MSSPIDNDNLYLNISFDHNSSYGTNPSPAVYNVTKTSPIVEKSDEWYTSVIRFSIPMNAVPLYYVPVIPNQPDPNLTAMVIGISYGGNYYPSSVIYVPHSASIPVPQQNIRNKMVVTQYYFQYDYEGLISMINTALNESYVAFKTVNPTAPQAISNDYPYLFYDPDTELISMVAHSSFLISGAQQALIFINEALINFVDGFASIDLQYNSLIGAEFAFKFPDINSPNSNSYGYAKFGVAPTYPPTWYKITQNYNTLSNWTCVKKLFMTTTTIPVNFESLPSSLENSGTNNNQPILTDFVPHLENVAGMSKSIAYYTPAGQYRLIDLISKESIRTIDIKIYWEDRNHNIFPLLISMYQQATMKMVFLKKSLYKGSNMLKYN